MKKFITVLALGLILFATSSEAGKKTKFRTGQIYEGTIIYEGGLSVDLPPGKWTMLGRWEWTVSAVRADGLTLAQLDGNVLKGMVSFLHVDSGGKWISYVNDWLRSVYIVNKTDGCYERSEYYLVERYKSGAGFNCLVVRHVDVMKEMHNPDKDMYKYSDFKSGYFKVWIRKNNIKVPMVMLASEHIFYASSVRNKVLGVGYIINPELYGASKTEFGTEETSEYHRANINRYPDKKKYMENWIKIAAKRHKVFEKDVGAKERHKLDLDKYGATEPIEEIKSTSKKTKETKTETESSDIVEDLEQLNELYKRGSLTKEEYKKAKSLLLNN